MKHHLFSESSHGLNFVAIGGGNGLSTLLRGLKKYVNAAETEPVWLENLSAIVAAWMVCGMMFQKKRQGTIHESTRNKPGFSSRVFAAVSCEFVDRCLCSALIFFFAFFGLLVIAYLTHQQPIIFPRYGLILFSLGVPILAWTLLRLRQQKPQWARRLLICTVAICVFDASIQLVGAVGILNQTSAERAVADYLRDHFDARSDNHIFCDEGTVAVMSGIPAEKFLNSLAAPRDREIEASRARVRAADRFRSSEASGPT